MSDNAYGKITLAERQRLWTPWRMRYIASSGAREEGCVFCNALARENDIASLILHRGEHAFVMMNLFPYNTGHIMIVPNDHVDDPTKLDTATVHEMADLMPFCVRALRRVYANQGFNIGYNVGSAAGAGIAEHLHQHIVPRWNGDANFMPVLASTIAMPELIPASYAKIRAEFQREKGTRPLAWVVMFTDEDRAVMIHDQRVPRVTAEEDQPMWRAAVALFRDWMDEIEVTGWGGSPDSRSMAENTIVLRGRVVDRSTLPDGWVTEALDISPFVIRDARIIQTALDNLAPRIGPPPGPETT